MVKAPGRTPAVAAAEDRLVAVSAAHAVNFFSRDAWRLVPGEFDELVAAARAALSRFLPAAPDRRAGDSRSMVDGRGDDVGNVARIWILEKGPPGDDPFALDIDLESAPVARGDLSLTCGTISHWHLPQRVASTRMEVRLRQSGPVVKLCAKPSPAQMETKHSRNSSHAKISSNGGQNFGAFDPAH